MITLSEICYCYCYPRIPRNLPSFVAGAPGPTFTPCFKHAIVHSPVSSTVDPSHILHWCSSPFLTSSMSPFPSLSPLTSSPKHVFVFREQPGIAAVFWRTAFDVVCKVQFIVCSPVISRKPARRVHLCFGQSHDGAAQGDHATKFITLISSTSTLHRGFLPVFAFFGSNLHRKLRTRVPSPTHYFCPSSR